MLDCRAVRPTNLLAAAALLGLVAQVPLLVRTARADGVANRADVLPASALKRGMKGYGLTVFEGTKPEKFDVEIIDVLYNFRPRQELILVKTTHPRLEVAKVVAGMSGSPIYIDGKMVGAYAYGWAFGREPVAGVTPIRSMLDDLDRPLPKSIDGWPLEVLPSAKSARRASVHARSANRFASAPGRYDVVAHAAQIGAARAAQGPAKDSPVAPVATPLLVGGMTPGAISFAKEVFGPMGLEPLQAGGGGETDPSAPTRFVDGGAVGVQLIRGDMSAMGMGTVTRVEGDKLLAFGHPMMFSGVTALPTAVGKVLWFLASDMRSFKIGMPARPVGALINDRMASIVVSHSAVAPVMPVSMKVIGAPGAPYTTWNFEVSHEKFMTPAFIAVALGNALQATAAEKQDVSWTAQSKFWVKGHGAVSVKDYGVSIGGTPSPQEFIGSNLVRSMGVLLNNPWEPVILEKAEVVLELKYSRDIYRLRGAEILEPEIDAGQPARVRLTLLPYSGPAIHQVIAVPLPKDLAGKTVQLDIAPGYTHLRERPSPDSLADLVKNLEDPVYPPKSVVVSFDRGDGGLMFKGHIAENLPPGAVDMIQPTSGSLAPEAFKSEVRQIVPIPQFMVGRDRVSVKIKPVLR